MSLPLNLPTIRGSDNLPDQLYAILSRAIIEGRFRPGDRIQPDEIAAHFEVSKIPVREALRSLEANGWINIRPRRGVYVQEHTAEELSNLYETRFIMEPRLARLAAERRTPAHLAKIRASMKQSLEALKRESSMDLAASNQAFHAACAEAAGNAYAAKIIGDIEVRLQWYYSHVPMERTRQTLKEHEMILQAIEAGDGQAAEEATVLHLEATRKTALSRLSNG
ncbi:GntR family transcriptional regulator [Rhodovarius crocodyli]|uniref:GntR family transcriptional regulator n=1 Tax=Rhodovarius crocodyli TaxID=1979269 RepID=A0A437MHD6_9PROT|nr:GntR family transcriptional regulator [Rhodovarius crocodyli]RVT97015.1 GntR family transcriptional regulator [Rhodovarius crocodyli]